MVEIIVAPAYGYVIAVAISSVFMLLWKASKVGQARKKFNVQYPTLYSPDKKHFNCYQRAHQNTLEYYPIFLVLLLLGGLEWPLASAVGGLVWVVGRVVYALGYYTGDPENRLKGAFSYVGLLVLLAATSKLSMKLIGIL